MVVSWYIVAFLRCVIPNYKLLLLIINDRTDINKKNVSIKYFVMVLIFS